MSDPDDDGGRHADTVKHVVFTQDEELKPGHMLGVAEGRDELEEIMDRWWKAFQTGEKAKPKEYRGIGHRPVADFDQWSEGSDDE